MDGVGTRGSAVGEGGYGSVTKRLSSSDAKLRDDPPLAVFVGTPTPSTAITSTDILLWFSALTKHPHSQALFSDLTLRYEPTLCS